MATNYAEAEQKNGTETEHKTGTVEFLEAQLGQLKDQFSELAASVEAGASKAGERAKASAQSAADDVALQIMERPWTAAGLTFGIGVLIGVLMGRR